MPVDVRKGQGDVKLTREEFERRLRERFFDPEFDRVAEQISSVVDIAGFRQPGLRVACRMAPDTRCDSTSGAAACGRDAPGSRADRQRRGTTRSDVPW